MLRKRKLVTTFLTPILTHFQNGDDSFRALGKYINLIVSNLTMTHELKFI